MKGAKAELRRLVLARRDAEPDREDRSARILQRLVERPEYRDARTVMTYVGVGSEVATVPLIEAMLASGRRVVVPWCQPDDLRLFELRSLGELEAAPYGLLEPGPALRAEPGREPEVAALDLVVVPGVAFDRRGGRLGHGKGYYDRLLGRRSPGTPAIALAFQCQMVEAVPMTERDVPVDIILTESGLYPGSVDR